MDTRPGLLLLGASHHTAPLAVRERFAVVPERLAGLHAALRRIAGLRECLVLNTCNRLEVYAVVEHSGSDAAVEECLCQFQGFPRAEFAQHRFLFRNAEVVRHLLEVSSGIDSQIVGEAEIFGQVKAAYAAAVGFEATGAVLNRVFQKAFQAAKYIRANTPIGEGQISVATVAVDLATKIFGNLADCRVLILGTGEVGEKTLKAFQSRGATELCVLSRSLERATTLARPLGARPGTMDEVAAQLPRHDVVIGSTITTDPVITAAMLHTALRGRQVRPIFLIDMGIPRNFEAAAGEIDSVFLYDLDDLARIADDNLAARRAAVERCREIAGERAARIWHGVEPRLDAMPAAIDSNELQTGAQAT